MRGDQCPCVSHQPTLPSNPSITDQSSQQRARFEYFDPFQTFQKIKDMLRQHSRQPSQQCKFCASALILALSLIHI